jgi:type IV pilus assembly protein PilA
VKQCPNCKGNLADYVPVCPYCGVNVAVTPVGSAQPVWTAPQEKSGKATASLVCGLVFFFWPLTALAAVILGHLALSDIKKSAGRLAGQGMAVAGLVLGYVELALLPFILIIAAIAIPNLLRSRMAANEASAVGTLRTYNTAMVTYAATCPNIGYPKKLANLGPGVTDTDKCAHADLVGAQMAMPVPVKYGYRFFYNEEPDTDGKVTRYVLSADPVAPGTSGVRHFFTDETGVIRFSAMGGADANSEPLQ